MNTIDIDKMLAEIIPVADKRWNVPMGKWIIEDCITIEQARALAERVMREQRIPKGWKLVPIEPTEKMLWEGHHKIDFDRTGQNTYEMEHESQTGTTIRTDMQDCYMAMIKAAPKAIRNQSSEQEK